jgi:putative methionine-R-sulfoxide reductase with GAF domain
VTHEERLARLFLDPIVNEYGYFWIGIYRVTQAGATRLTFRGDVPPCREFAFGHGNVGQAAETGQRKVIPDVSKDPQYSQCFIATKSEMVQPVLFRGARVGVIDAESDREGFFDAWQQQVLGLLAQRLAPVLAWPDLELALACAEAVDRLQERFAGRFAWTGVYALAPHGDLQLVSFLGPGTEHTRIPLNRGVCQPDVLVQVEGGDLGEVAALVAVQADQLVVGAAHRVAGGQAQHRAGGLVHAAGEEARREAAHLGVVGGQDDLHVAAPGEVAPGVLWLQPGALVNRDESCCNAAWGWYSRADVAVRQNGGRGIRSEGGAGEDGGGGAGAGAGRGGVRRRGAGGRA